MERRLALPDELFAFAEPLAARIQASAVYRTRPHEAGDVAGVDAEIERFEGEIDRFEVPSFFRCYGPHYRAMRAGMAGRLEEGERLALESFGHAQRAHVYDAQRALTAQIFQLRSDQGRLGEMEAPASDMASRVFGRFVDRYDPSLDDNRSVTMTILANVCAALDDAGRAAWLSELAHAARDAATATGMARIASQTQALSRRLAP